MIYRGGGKVMRYVYIASSNELYHYGIKGMRWGVRRFQNNDGSLTAVGKKRYNVDVEGAKKRLESAKQGRAKAKATYNKATAGGLVANKKAADNLLKATDKVSYEKDRVRSEKVKNKLNSENGNKSKHRLKLEEEYRSKGMSEEEAAIAAYKRARTEKIIAVTAGVAITAVAAYVAYKHYDKTVDKFIKAGTELQNIAKRSDKGVSDAFYFSMTKGDNTKYRGLYGKTMRDMGYHVYETKIGTNSAMKIASQKSATKALSDLASSDSSYRKMLETHLNALDPYDYPSPNQQRVLKDALKSIQKGKIDEKVYNALNLSLSDHSVKTSEAVSKGFYNKLKSLGYDAIDDLNDKNWSGYHSSKPMIAFNAANKAAVKSVREVGQAEIQKAYNKGMGELLVRSLTPTVAGTTAYAGALHATSKLVQQKKRDQIVSEYRKKHPGTSLSYNQILDQYYG